MINFLILYQNFIEPDYYPIERKFAKVMVTNDDIFDIFSFVSDHLTRNHVKWTNFWAHLSIYNCINQIRKWKRRKKMSSTKKFFWGRLSFVVLNCLIFSVVVNMYVSTKHDGNNFGYLCSVLNLILCFWILLFFNLFCRNRHEE